ncbi:hypothetical protein [Paludibacterium denitrificans]|uniref:hypothetical protein n=1 Tax=Paludibacterium denitrificans TaxID=2675226 RepID=UPI001E2F183E|nr:hypothetical protein [Paludibacterium denitrificans]
MADRMETGPEAINPDNSAAGKKDSGHLQHHVAALKAREAATPIKRARPPKTKAVSNRYSSCPARPVSPVPVNKARPSALKHQP